MSVTGAELQDMIAGPDELVKIRLAERPPQRLTAFVKREAGVVILQLVFGR